MKNTIILTTKLLFTRLVINSKFIELPRGKHDFILSYIISHYRQLTLINIGPFILFYFILFYFILFYFIYLPHTIKYIINKHNKDH